MKDHLNARVKHREGFRPFAPSVLEEWAGDWFELFDKRYSYMLRVVPVRPEKKDLIPAITHVDGTARIQTVSNEENPGYWRQINEFYKQTGVPLVLNTSFNIAGKPIVEKPEDAVACFKGTEIDLLTLGSWIVSKRPLDEYLSNSR
jgi:carbamoyltransferase